MSNTIERLRAATRRASISDSFVLLTLREEGVQITMNARSPTRLALNYIVYWSIIEQSEDNILIQEIERMEETLRKKEAK